MKKYRCFEQFITTRKRSKRRLVKENDIVIGEIDSRNTLTLNLYSFKTGKYIGYIETSDINKLLTEI